MTAADIILARLGHGPATWRNLTAALIDSGRFVDCMTLGYCKEETAKLAESLIKQGKIEICDGLYLIATKKGTP
jgi:hypothetical protein